MQGIFTTNWEKWSLRMCSSATQVGSFTFDFYSMVATKIVFLIKPRWGCINFVSYVFHRKVILDDVSFTVLPGQTVALVMSPPTFPYTNTACLPYGRCSIIYNDAIYHVLFHLPRWGHRGLGRAPSFDSSSASMMSREVALALMARIYQK